MSELVKPSLNVPATSNAKGHDGVSVKTLTAVELDEISTRKTHTFEELNPLPDDIIGVIERLFEIRWSQNHLDAVDPAWSEVAVPFRPPLELWVEDLKKSEVQCREELDRRLAGDSGQDRVIARQYLQRRKGDDVLLSQLSTADLKSKIDLQEQENLLNELRARVSIKNRQTPLDDREKVIRQAVRDGLKGRRYAEYLDFCGVETPEPWQKDKNNRCLKRYAEAYKDPHWKQAIHREKSRVAARMKR